MTWPLGLERAGAGGVAAGLSIFATGKVLAYLRRRDYVDRPNERSSHKIATPRGGGLGVTPAVLVVWAGLAVLPGTYGNWAWVSLAGSLVLLMTSWADDRHNLPAAPRFLAHACVVIGGLAALPHQDLVFQGALPWGVDRAITALAWLWFVNLFNFMDGIDGITGIETACIGVGLVAVTAVAGLAGGLDPFALALAGAALGFLVWNWHPAKVFLGDSGSIPLGFLVGGLLVQLAVTGHLTEAIILPAYYLADATITITRRALRGEKVWQAHRQHFYQRAIQGGMRHDQVTLTVLAINLLLITAALLTAAGQEICGVGMAVVVVAGGLGVFQRWSRRRPA